MSEQAGPILDGLGITLDLGDGDLVASAMIVAKVVRADGQVTLLIEDSEGMTWLDQYGLIAAASDLIRSPSFERDDDD
ncbi:hypothetical protein [Micromonospora aurantiaca]|uniref:Uncharacterized protein n=1 Tax=Micromonospora aurantiaca (nom. illeg.) TaxID=47850 RepID=A0A6N3JVM6_9ACTN|nr:hypothetical protein [Micromonospora aurantiaca]AXH89422.1 hypothetical protein DVH21_05420 [Micromonospora aurantiaca]